MIHNMTPQTYPLGARTDGTNSPRLLVIGWVAEQGEMVPVTVVNNFSPRDGMPSTPKVTRGPLRYYLPATSVSVDGEIAVSEA